MKKKISKPELTERKARSTVAPEMDCPYCEGGKANLQAEIKTRNYKKRRITFHEYFYKCGKCKEEFTTNAVDEHNVYTVIAKYKGDTHIRYIG